MRAWELQPQHAGACRQTLRSLLTKRGVAPDTADHLAAAWVVEGDFLIPDDTLLAAGSGHIRADVVIGNPPYIRLEDLPPSLTSTYRRLWPTMGGRADVYVGFIERSLGLLRDGGRVGFICADRWMRNQYGDRLRQLVASKYSVEHVWVMHDVDAFESAVSAYPAITVVRHAHQGPVVAADTTSAFGRESAARLTRWTRRDDGVEFSGIGVTAHKLPHWFPGDESWPTGTPARLRLIEYLNDRFHPLHDAATRTKVSIGVATGADQVFVTTDSGVVESERLLPLSMVRDIASGEFQWSGHFLIDPWGSDGRLVDLERYPRLANYFDTTGAALRRRFVAKKSPGSWYRTIDKVHHDLIDKPKLLLQDMRTTIHPVLEAGGYYPHHNLYYIVSDAWDLEVLGGLLLSRVAQAFIEAYCVRMRGGTLRFQSQYLKRIRVPSPGDLNLDQQRALRLAFRQRDVDAATRAAASAYNITDLAEFDLA